MEHLNLSTRVSSYNLGRFYPPAPPLQTTLVPALTGYEDCYLQSSSGQGNEEKNYSSYTAKRNAGLQVLNPSH
jgi:hypothetical protein